MATDSTVDLYTPVESRAADGTVIKTWDYSSPNDSIIADVQPKTLTDAQLKEWGLDISQQAAKKVFDFSFSSYWAIPNHARVDGDKLYRILAVNPWGAHLECLLVPLVGS
jgi:hypothetical protein